MRNLFLLSLITLSVSNILITGCNLKDSIPQGNGETVSTDTSKSSRQDSFKTKKTIIQYGKVKKELRLRRAPNTEDNSNIITTLKLHESLQIIAYKITETPTWSKIIYKGDTGFVALGAIGDTFTVCIIDTIPDTIPNIIKPVIIPHVTSVDSIILDSLWHKLLTDVFVNQDTTHTIAKLSTDSLSKIVESQKIDKLVLWKLMNIYHPQKVLLPWWLPYLVGFLSLIIGILLPFAVIWVRYNQRKKTKKENFGKQNPNLKAIEATPSDVDYKFMEVLIIK